MHFLLERLFADHGSEAILQMTDSALHETVAGLIRGVYTAEFRWGRGQDAAYSSHSPPPCRFGLCFVAPCKGGAFQSDFVPAYFELMLERPRRADPCRMAAVTVVGEIDRVDIMDRDGQR